MPAAEHAAEQSKQRSRLAVICDLRAERWPSMDLVAEMLIENLAGSEAIDVRRICPELKVRFGRLPVIGASGSAFNADRLLNRMWDYPAHLHAKVNDADLFHIADHSYSHLALSLPTQATGIFCHDLDAFRCLLEPDKDPRPYWFRRMTARILRGFKSAALVFHSTNVVRDEIVRHGLIDATRLVHAPYGIAPEFRVDGGGAELETAVLARIGPVPFLLHVGSCIPRKRIDVLLHVFASLAGMHETIRLVQVGGTWTSQQRAQIDAAGLGARVFQLRDLTRATIAELYRRAAVTLLPSETEGFGLPVIEALACGGVVVASDIPVMREVGADAVLYCPVANIAAWTNRVQGLLSGLEQLPGLDQRLQRAARFSWSEHARIVGAAYQRLQGHS